MESVHFYEKKIESDVINILKNEEFMRISHIVRESNVLHSGKSGCILYVNASQEETDSISQKLKDLGAEKVIGEEEKTVVETFKAEEENAASGIGLMFG
jgi:transcriptional regulator of NAD metabolism